MLKKSILSVCVALALLNPALASDNSTASLKASDHIGVRSQHLTITQPFDVLPLLWHDLWGFLLKMRSTI